LVTSSPPNVKRYRPGLSQLARFGELAVLTVKFVSTAGWTTSGRLIDCVQNEGRIFEEMVSRAGLQPNRIDTHFDGYSGSFLD
jgi:hypothetical protein